MDKNITKVKILGMEYKISCPPEDSDQVKEAAKFFDKKLRETRENSKIDEDSENLDRGNDRNTKKAVKSGRRPRVSKKDSFGENDEASKQNREDENQSGSVGIDATEPTEATV